MLVCARRGKQLGEVSFPSHSSINLLMLCSIIKKPGRGGIPENAWCAAVLCESSTQRGITENLLEDSS